MPLTKRNFVEPTDPKKPRTGSLGETFVCISEAKIFFKLNLSEFLIILLVALKVLLAKYKNNSHKFLLWFPCYYLIIGISKLCFSHRWPVWTSCGIPSVRCAVMSTVQPTWSLWSANAGAHPPIPGILPQSGSPARLCR
jgi:hypothetical protein